MVIQMTMKSIKCYSEVVRLPTYLERYQYLRINGRVGEETFGYDRYLNQLLYRTPEWKRFRRDMILRDNGCDLACEDYEIAGNILLHHINPITPEDILRRDPKIFDPENVICTSLGTHNAIHYGDESLLCLAPIERRPYDTCPWRKEGNDGKYTKHREESGKRDAGIYGI